MFKLTSRLELFPIRVDQIAKRVKKKKGIPHGFKYFSNQKKKERYIIQLKV